MTSNCLICLANDCFERFFTYNEFELTRMNLKCEVEIDQQFDRSLKYEQRVKNKIAAKIRKLET